MIARFRISLANSPTPELMHQLRNYGEYVHGIVAGKALVDMHQVDSATEFFLVEVMDKRNLGAVRPHFERAQGQLCPIRTSL